MAPAAPPTMEKERLQGLLQINLDARRYFYHNADERWLEWLWRNGFLDILKEEGESLNGFRTPELEYLLRMAEERPETVVEIILDTSLSTDARSQEVAYGFLRICGALPPDQLARVVDKIRVERWVPLIDKFYSKSGFAYEEMLTALADANDFGSFLALAEAALAVSSERRDGPDEYLYREYPFYIENLSRTKLFEQLAAVSEEYAERALALTTNKLAEIIATSDQFLLLEIDFLHFGNRDKVDGWQEDARELAAAAKALAVRLIGKRCSESIEVRRIYNENLASLSDSRVMWRFRLFVLSLCPLAFRDELKSAFFQLFEVERHREIASGAEYEKALRKGFSLLSENEKKEYVLRTIQEFSQPPEGRIYKGSFLLSVILPYLDENPALKRQVEEAGYRLYPNYEPRPNVVFGGRQERRIHIVARGQFKRKNSGC